MEHTLQKIVDGATTLSIMGALGALMLFITGTWWGVALAVGVLIVVALQWQNVWKETLLVKSVAREAETAAERTGDVLAAAADALCYALVLGGDHAESEVSSALERMGPWAVKAIEDLMDNIDDVAEDSTEPLSRRLPRLRDVLEEIDTPQALSLSKRVPEAAPF